MLNYSANGPSGYNLTNSLRFRGSASAYLSRTPASAGNRTTWTWSGWVKRGTLSTASSQTIFGCSTGGSSPNFQCRFATQDTFDIYDNSGSIQWRLTTTQVFRDPSAWYHIVVAFDSTQATSSNRVKIYVNGTQITAFGTATYPTQNYNSYWNSTLAAGIGLSVGDQFDGYLTEVNFIDGQALTPSSFGSTNSTTGVWQPAKYTGTYGTNGFYLKFSNIALTSGSNTGLGQDFSGNGNYWNTNNISVTSGTTYDAMTDVPTLTSTTTANYCVLNPLQAGSYVTASNGNLTLTGNTSTNSAIATASFSFTSGKYYYEYTQGTALSETCGFALTPVTGSLIDGEVFAANNAFGARAAGTTFGTSKIASSLTSWTSGDIVGIAIDADNGAAYWSKNGVWQTSGVPTSGASKTGAVAGWTPTASSIVTPFFGAYNGGFINANFGQRPFAYTAPSGYLPLNTYNLPTSTIVQGNKYMDATLYTGTGVSLPITNAGGFKPDLVWMKSRSNATFNDLTDSVRGVTKVLYSNDTRVEDTISDNLTSFDTNGFTIAANSTFNTINVSPRTYVAWQWQAGQGTNTTNTSGSITSTVSVNASAGFSIVTYTGNGSAGATIGHGLGVVPAMTIIKERSSVRYWIVWQKTMASYTNDLYLNTSDAINNDSQFTAAPTSSILTLRSGGSVNNSGQTYVAYCWAEIAGFSKFGSYTGNGSTDGPFVYTGFRPKYVMIKVTSITNVWLIIDTSRSPYNVANLNLNANDSVAENTASTGAWLDFLSNGFKIRNGTDGAINTNGNNYIYACFAENPFKNSLAR